MTGGGEVLQEISNEMRKQGECANIVLLGRWCSLSFFDRCSFSSHGSFVLHGLLLQASAIFWGCFHFQVNLGTIKHLNIGINKISV